MNQWEIKASELRIKEYLSSRRFQEYFNFKKQYLQIEDVTLETRVESPKYFSTECTLGTIGSKLTIEKIKFISINYKKIASNCLSVFGSLYAQRSLYNEILDIYVRWVVVHELIHIKQVKSGWLNKNLLEKEKDKKNEEEKVYEQEAIERAAYLISKDGPLEEKFLKCVNGKELLSNDEQKSFAEIFSSIRE